MGRLKHTILKLYRLREESRVSLSNHGDSFSPLPGFCWPKALMANDRYLGSIRVLFGLSFEVQKCHFIFFRKTSPILVLETFYI